jgi:hypothetical protein
MPTPLLRTGPDRAVTLDLMYEIKAGNIQIMNRSNILKGCIRDCNKLEAKFAASCRFEMTDR